MLAAFELGDPGSVRRLGDGAEEDLGAVGGTEGRELLLVGEGTAVDGRRLERPGPLGRGRWIGDLEPDRRHGRAAVARVLLVAHHARRSLGPETRVLAAMPPPEGEPELPEQDVDLTGVVGTHLDEVEGGRFGHRRQPHDRVGAADTVRARAGGDEVLHPRERAPCLTGGPGDIGLPEDVVEDLERERPVVPRAQDVAHEGAEVEGPLAGKQPVVARPGQHVHGEQRSVCELQEEDLRSGDVLDRAGIVAAGEDVEAVEAGPDGWMVRELDDSPGASVVVDEPPPRQGFVGDPDAVRRGLLAQPAQL